jgi:hypothetical protein
VLICDTGPLVAAALTADPDHRACVDLFTGAHLAGRPPQRAQERAGQPKKTDLLL